MSARPAVVCLSSIDWDFIWQGHQEIMSRLAGAGHQVLFVENTGVRRPGLADLARLRHRLANWRRGPAGIRNAQENLFVCSPLLLPLPYSRWAVRVNRWLLALTVRRWLKAVGGGEVVLWTFLPTPLALGAIEDLDPALAVYYCISSFEDSSPQARRIVESEPDVVRRADLVFADAHRLVERLKRWRPDVHRFPFGVNLEAFQAARDADVPCPEDLAAIRRPRIGYIGGIHQWVDFGLLAESARRCPEYSFVLVGPEQTDTAALRGLANVRLLGQRPRELIPDYIRHFDACVIPYRLTEYTAHVYPTKLNEYLAMGKPVVSTRLPEVERFNRELDEPAVEVADGPEDFAACLKRAVGERSAPGVGRRIAAAERNGWAARVAAMRRLMEDKLDERRRGRVIGWRDRMAGLGRRGLRRLAFPAAAAAVGYALLFHTPLLWWAARPLKLTDPPSHADAIVVFAGGVGESGRAGQGHQERVQHAVGLYRQGLARKVIFSSGYVYVLKEARVMKMLAVGLGVPERAIFIEERAANTYDNVVFSTLLMRRLGLRSALVVSAPYHMRRVKLVWKRVAPDLRVGMAPVPGSRFYGEEGAVQWQHVRAIAQEYLAIGWYRLRGYIG